MFFWAAAKYVNYQVTSWHKAGFVWQILSLSLSLSLLSSTPPPLSLSLSSVLRVGSSGWMSRVRISHRQVPDRAASRRQRVRECACVCACVQERVAGETRACAGAFGADLCGFSPAGCLTITGASTGGTDKLQAWQTLSVFSCPDGTLRAERDDMRRSSLHPRHHRHWSLSGGESRARSWHHL